MPVDQRRREIHPIGERFGHARQGRVHSLGMKGASNCSPADDFIGEVCIPPDDIIKHVSLFEPQPDPVQQAVYGHLDFELAARRPWCTGSADAALIRLIRSQWSRAPNSGLAAILAATMTDDYRANPAGVWVAFDCPT